MYVAAMIVSLHQDRDLASHKVHAPSLVKNWRDCLTVNDRWLKNTIGEVTGDLNRKFSWRVGKYKLASGANEVRDLARYMKIISYTYRGYLLLRSLYLGLLFSMQWILLGCLIMIFEISMTSVYLASGSCVNTLRKTWYYLGLHRSPVQDQQLCHGDPLTLRQPCY